MVSGEVDGSYGHLTIGVKCDMSWDRRKIIYGGDLQGNCLCGVHIQVKVGQNYVRYIR